MGRMCPIDDTTLISLSDFADCQDILILHDLISSYRTPLSIIIESIKSKELLPPLGGLSCLGDAACRLLSHVRNMKKTTQQMNKLKFLEDISEL